MIATIKLTMFGFNVLDGRQKTNLTAYNKQMKIDDFPTLAQFFGWMYFFGGYLVGPSCEYMDYIRFVQLDDKARRSMPSAIKPTLVILSKSLLFITVLVMFSPTYNFSALLKSEWRDLPLWQKLLSIQLVALVTRCKYYAVWLLSEGACVLCGFGFNGYEDDGKPRFDRLTNINVLKCELSQSVKELGDNWNMAANRWLKHYVYLRVTPPNKKAGAASSLVTYAVSALWHGFYPGYYVMFFSLAMYQNIGKRLRRCLRPLMMAVDGKSPVPGRKTVYDTLGVIVTMFIINTVSTSFVGLYLQPVLQIWKDIYFIHYILALLTIAVLQVVYGPLITLQKKRASESGYISKTPTAKPKAKDDDVTDIGGVEPPPNDPILVKQRKSS
ncbi:MBOAT-domain-containing protein [Hesseltinella vesiculosa]|uniref:MBOAT-domain-containing protein n=1 Tax=Hesseltinella vesiculosa TaxID=101127 RepID=A0A1X2GLR6_9FUNG|nr:MBOAT-domain-containing protein [Hesseltinella vesiculosa]